MRSILNTQVRISQVAFNVKTYGLSREDEEPNLHWLHRTCQSRLKEQLYCPTCQVIPGPDEQVRGTQTPTGVVLLEEAEIQGIYQRPDKTLDVEFFTAQHQLHPEWLHQGYGLVPSDDPSRRGYHLLADVLRRDQLIAITRLTPRTRTKVAAIVVVGQQLHLWSLRYAEMLQPIPDPAPAPPSQEEVRLARRLAQSMTRPFDYLAYRDDTMHRLQELIESKQTGTPAKVPLVQMAALPAQATILAALRASMPAKRKATKK